MAKRKGKTKVVTGRPLKQRKAIYRPRVRKAMPKSCFLRPSTRSYPVCPASTARTGKKVIDCRLVRAAKTRAAQHGHKAVLAKAKRLEARYCSKK